MNQNIGRVLTYNAAGAPQVFTGECTAYDYEDVFEEAMIVGASQDNIALIQHSHIANWRFSAKINAASTDFLDLSAGCVMSVPAISETGILAGLDAEEVWMLDKEKTATVSGIHLIDATSGMGSTTAPGTMTAITPATLGTPEPLIYPTGAVTFSTAGLGINSPGGSAMGDVHMLRIKQSWKHDLHKPTPNGQILGANVHGYSRSITMSVLAIGAPIVNGTTLAITGAPSQAANFMCKNVKTLFALGAAKMYEFGATWIPPFGSGS